MKTQRVYTYDPPREPQSEEFPLFVGSPSTTCRTRTPFCDSTAWVLSGCLVDRDVLLVRSSSPPSSSVDRRTVTLLRPMTFPTSSVSRSVPVPKSRHVKDNRVLWVIPLFCFPFVLSNESRGPLRFPVLSKSSLLHWVVDFYKTHHRHKSDKSCYLISLSYCDTFGFL